MDKVHGAITALECVDILKVNVEEDTEVVHSGFGSGSGSGYVKNEDIETDASKNAEPPVHIAGTASERKRKSSAASDASTLPKKQMKVKTDKDNSTQQSKTGFDERCNQLLRFKEEFGHCNIPKRYAGNPSLGEWCSHTRSAYKKIQKGMKANSNLSQDRIERLEEIGFQWKVNVTFEERCHELIAFKEEFGHCNVTRRYAGNPSLGQWCRDIRNAYNRIQKGLKTNSNLSQGRIERLKEIGFKWQVLMTDYDKVFQKHCCDLTSFKEEFGHCNVPSRYAGNPSLGHWCGEMRRAYNRIQKGMKTNYNLSQARIEHLEEIGFQWKVNVTLEEPCCDLTSFKEEFGHCNVTRRYAGNLSLGKWCCDIRNAYKKIQTGLKTNSNLSQDRIERLKEIGFQWKVNVTFKKHCRELIAFKEEFGHCNVPGKYAGNPSLGQWCRDIRNAYKKVQKGMKASSNLSQDRIERVEEIGFEWQI